MVTTPGWLVPTLLVDTRLQLLGDAPRPLKHNSQVKFFHGAAQVTAQMRLLGDEQLVPGAEGWVQFRLSEPLNLVKGDRFIVRQPSPSITLGGGHGGGGSPDAPPSSLQAGSHGAAGNARAWLAF